MTHETEPLLLAVEGELRLCVESRGFTKRIGTCQCILCNGAGVVFDFECPYCHGFGMRAQEERLDDRASDSEAYWDFDTQDKLKDFAKAQLGARVVNIVASTCEGDELDVRCYSLAGEQLVSFTLSAEEEGYGAAALHRTIASLLSGHSCLLHIVLPTGSLLTQYEMRPLRQLLLKT